MKEIIKNISVRIWFSSSLVVVLMFVFAHSYAAKSKIYSDMPFAPEFSQTDSKYWINASPKKISDYKGKVLLIDVWTFSCWNCYRSFPWMTATENKYKSKGLEVVGIHTPEFDHEKVRRSIEEKAKEFNLHHPIMMDNDFTYWRALNNQYWPAYYLIDKKGRIRHLYIGETHANTPKSKAIDLAIEVLLAEK